MGYELKQITNNVSPIESLKEEFVSKFGKENIIKCNKQEDLVYLDVKIDDKIINFVVHMEFMQNGTIPVYQTDTDSMKDEVLKGDWIMYKVDTLDNVTFTH